MPEPETHDIWIIINRLNSMKGNATSGFLFDLYTTVVAAKEVLDNGDPANREAIEAQIHVIGEWTDDSFVCVPEMTADLQALL